MSKAIAVAAVWLGPAFACWTLDEPTVAFVFVASIIGTWVICISKFSR